MTRSGLLGSSALRSAALLGLAIASASPAYAQQTTVDADAPETLQSEVEIESGEDASTDLDNSQTVVVTGSRIRRPNLTSVAPITTFSGDSVYKQAENNLGEALNDLPALRSTFSQSNPGLSLGITGLNLLDLRGLGVERTLVLVNGRRHIASDVLNTGVSVDINTIPTALVERVDIVTGGSSAVYGSDAIAGVVNFILKDDFEGIDLRAGASIPEFGVGLNHYFNATAGMNFGDGRGNVAVNAEYSRQDRVFFDQVPRLRRNDGFNTIDTDASGSDGIPDAVFTRDIRTGTISRGSLIAFPQKTPNAACGGSTIPNAAGNTSPFNCNFIFLPDGTLVPQTFTGRISNSVFGGFIGGNGDVGREGVQASLFPFNERYVVNFLGKYEFSPAAEVFVEAKYARQNVEGSNLGSVFNQGIFTFADERQGPRIDNPFLSQQARNVIIANLNNPNFNQPALINAFGGCGATCQAEVAAGTYRFQIARAYEDLGQRDEFFNRDTYRIVGGLRGELSQNFSYEVSGNYGRAKQLSTLRGIANYQRLFLASDAGIDPADGKIKCRSQFDPSAAFATPDSANQAVAEANLAADIAACVPYNPFGLQNGQAVRDYIVGQDAQYTGRLEQININGFLSGSTASLFELPGGPIGFVIGGEYRREQIEVEVDDIIQQGQLFFNELVPYKTDALKVKEAYGEIEFPIFRDRPFFQELVLTAAGRVSDYNGATGTVYAYNVGGRYSPVPDITFRANFGRAVRAPNLNETQEPIGQDFAPGFLDPCNQNRLGNGSATRAANCAADLGNLLNNVDFQTFTDFSYSPEILSGSNPNLTEETSDSLTLGVVFQPRFLPGFAITADYYNIEVKDVIVAPTAQQIVNACYDLPDLNNQFCALFERNGAGTGPEAEVPGQILEGSLLQAPINFASRRREGIDFDVSYRSRLGADSSINARLLYTHVLKSSNFEDPTRPEFENRVLSELGDPKDQANLDIDLTFGEFTIGYGLQYIGEQLSTTYEAQNSLNGQAPTNPDAFDILKYPDVFYHDIRLGWVLPKTETSAGFEFFVGVDNVLDTKPPFGLTGADNGGRDNGSAIYEPWGRRYYAGARARF